MKYCKLCIWNYSNIIEIIEIISLSKETTNFRRKTRGNIKRLIRINMSFSNNLTENKYNNFWPF